MGYEYAWLLKEHVSSQGGFVDFLLQSTLSTEIERSEQQSY